MNRRIDLPQVSQSADRREPTGLFRADALAFHRVVRLGSTRIAGDAPVGSITLLLTVVVAALLGFVGYGQYARKESVEGFLEPDRGVIRVFSPRGGVISDVRVADGQSVDRDEVLFKVVDLQSMADGADADSELLTRYGRERDSLTISRDREAQRFATEGVGLRAQLAIIAMQMDANARLMDVQTEQANLREAQMDAIRVLHDRGAIATIDWLLQREQSLQLREKLQSTRQSANRLAGERAAVLAKLAQLPIDHADRLAEVESRLAAVERSQVQLRARRAFEVRSPVGGRVVSVRRKVGEAASPDDAALTIIPNDSILVGRLLIPTSAIGFVQPGESVRVRYDAFPYQHFGVHRAVVRDVARGVLFSGDSYGPLRVTKPAYPATVALSSQAVTADAREVPLQSGMLLRADIILERRSILEWIFEPLLGTRGRT
jgi:membrane fusion protein